LPGVKAVSPVKPVLLIGFVALSVAVPLAAYGRSDHSWAAVSGCILLFGCMLLGNLVVVWPGAQPAKQGPFRAGSSATLAAWQVWLFLGWFLAVGGLSVWFWGRGL